MSRFRSRYDFADTKIPAVQAAVVGAEAKSQNAATGRKSLSPFQELIGIEKRLFTAERQIHLGP